MGATGHDHLPSESRLDGMRAELAAFQRRAIAIMILGNTVMAALVFVAARYF